MKFKTWIENEVQTPGSAGVLRTGLQPQVDAEEIQTSQKDDQDRILAVDAHFQRVKASIQCMPTGSPRLKELRDFVRKVLKEWEFFKNRQDGEVVQDEMPGPDQNQVGYMKFNQPLSGNQER